jgi:hypothetical protein
LAAGIGGRRRGLERGAATELPLKIIRMFGMVSANGGDCAQAEPLRQSRNASRSNRIFVLEQKTRTV